MARRRRSGELEIDTFEFVKGLTALAVAAVVLLAIACVLVVLFALALLASVCDLAMIASERLGATPRRRLSGSAWRRVHRTVRALAKEL
jgi:hypothetical protein